MRWVLIVLGSIIGLIVLIALIGLLLPRNHRATSRLAIPQPPDTVWSTVRDFGQVAAWWPEVKKVERLEDAEGRERWRESMGGDMALVLRIAEERPPTSMRSVIEETGQPFGGEWVYTISADDAGSVVEITEDGWVSNPIFRVVSRIIGHHRTMDSYLSALGRKFGVTASPEHVT
jgi:Polyketide cyclase / dehydrase and lipid transport